MGQRCVKRVNNASILFVCLFVCLNVIFELKICLALFDRRVGGELGPDPLLLFVDVQTALPPRPVGRPVEQKAKRGCGKSSCAAWVGTRGLVVFPTGNYNSTNIFGKYIVQFGQIYFVRNHYVQNRVVPAVWSSFQLIGNHEKTNILESLFKYILQKIIM